MADQATAVSTVRAALRDSRYAVLATEAGGQPHASLMAFAAVAGGRELLFATYRNTRKHHNLVANPRVALFIDHCEAPALRTSPRQGLTAVGNAGEVQAADAEAARAAIAQSHPDLEGFLQHGDCVLLRLAVEWYQVTGGIDDVGWCPASALDGDDAGASGG